MGLSSSLAVALTGLQAAETQIDVIGNNLANSQTIGFKESQTVFATQLLQTQSLGSAPSATNGGTNPRQIGLGTKIAAINPDFGQGTIEVSPNQSDLALQGNGFFIVQGNDGGELYTRNGQFKTNATSELVNPSGFRVLGYGIDDNFEIQETSLVPLTIPLGKAAVAEPTTEVILEGNLTPTGDLADTAEVIESAVLGDSTYPAADGSAVNAGAAVIPDSSGTSITHTDGGGSHPEGAVYRYKFVYLDSSNTESVASTEVVANVPAGDTLANNSINLNNLPAASGAYTQVRIYRTADGGSDYFLLDTVAAGSNYVDDNSIPLSGNQLDETSIDGSYSYKITYYRNGFEETRPSDEIGPISVNNGRIQLSNFPTPPTPGPSDGFPQYTEVRIYRSLATNTGDYYLVGTVNPGDAFTDNRTDADISDLTNPNNQLLDEDGPKMTGATLLTEVLKRDGGTYQPLFSEGTLTFEHRKGGRSIGEKSFTIAADSTVFDLLQFMEQATGIFSPADDPTNPIPGSVNNIPGETGTLNPGATINDGRFRFVSNNGVLNALDIQPGAFTLTDTLGNVTAPNLNFGSIQEAVGQSAVTDMVAYDSLGIPIAVRITAVLEARDSSSTTYRWFAESPDNDPLSGEDITVGTGLVTLGGEGEFLSATNTTVSVDRWDTPSASPLNFELDFTSLSGLAGETPILSFSRQDGSPPGTLTSYSVGEDGLVRGIFSNGTTRDLGQIRLARFANPSGLEQRGDNTYADSQNAGRAYGNPGQGGIGTLIAGARELSNTDIGRNLVDLVLASTLYRGNTRVITTSQQLLDELLNLRR